MRQKTTNSRFSTREAFSLTSYFYYLKSTFLDCTLWTGWKYLKCHIYFLVGMINTDSSLNVNKLLTEFCLPFTTSSQCIKRKNVELVERFLHPVSPT